MSEFEAVIKLFDHVENTGYRFKQVPGAAFATAWSTLTGETFTFVAGWLVG